MRTVILQRMVPHYRRDLFQRLHERFGWIVATDQLKDKFGIPGVTDEPWLRTFAFKSSARNQYRATVPTREILSSLEADAVIAEFTPNLSSTWSLAAAAAAHQGPRLIFWSQGWNVERGFRRPLDLSVQATRLALMAPADGQLCYSEAGAAYLRRWMPRRQGVFTARNTVDVDRYPARELVRAGDDDGNLLFVGRLTPDKNVPMLIEIFAAASKRLPGLRLTVVGDGPDLPAVQAAAEGVDGVTLAGQVYDKDVLAGYFNAAGLFVYAGSIGLAANQALAYGVPVMIFDSPPGGIHHHPEHEYVVDGYTGIRVKSSTAEAYANRLVAELSGPGSLRSRLESGIRRYVQDNLSLDSMVEGFVDVASFLERIGPRRG